VLLLALLAALGSALAYGASTAAQHSAMAGPDGGSLGRLVRSPRWLLGMGGDTVGMVLQIVALAAGPVVLVQPILVLALPISLPIAWALGGTRPGRREAIGCAWMLAGLVAFFLLSGIPSAASPAAVPGVVLAVTVALVAGGVLLALVRRSGPVVRAATYGGVAGCWFGLVAVLVDVCATVWSSSGVAGLLTPSGLTPLVALLALGGLSIVLTQVAFRVGPLAAGFPANLAADPVVAVAVGAVLLGERVPADAWHLVGYAAAVTAVVVGAVRLASGTGRPR
jgi:drug/metabolite transporter (DMT)-like permease